MFKYKKTMAPTDVQKKKDNQGFVSCHKLIFYEYFDLCNFFFGFGYIDFLVP